MSLRSSLSNWGHQERSPSGAGEGGGEEVSVREQHRRNSPGGHLQTAQVFTYCSGFSSQKKFSLSLFSWKSLCVFCEVRSWRRTSGSSRFCRSSSLSSVWRTDISFRLWMLRGKLCVSVSRRTRTWGPETRWELRYTPFNPSFTCSDG